MDFPKLCTTRLLDQNFGMCISPEDTMLPFYNFQSSYFRPWKLCSENVKDFGSMIDSSKDKLQINLDVQYFKPNEVSVKITNKEVIVEGKHEERGDEHGFISRHFIRRYVVPENCLSETITSTLSSDGVLIIMANKKLEKTIDANATEVSIKSCLNTAKKPEATITTNNGIAKNEITDSISEMIINKKESHIKLNEDHCRLLKPELLKEAASGTEKLLSESRKETDELLKLMSSDKSAQVVTNATSEKLEDVLGQCKTAIAELTEKFGETNVSTGSSEMSSMKSSMTSETIESVQTSSSMCVSSSTSSSMKATSEKTSELQISAELKEAASII